MKTRNNKGFTLIELLVVIAIIGMLATLAIVSLNSARKKARDARRLSDLSQVANALEISDLSNPGAALACASAANTVSSGCTDAIADLTWANFKDPDGSAAATACPAGAAPGSKCGYTIFQGSTTGKYSICFYMEDTNNLGGGAAGLKTLKSGRVYVDGCVAP